MGNEAAGGSREPLSRIVQAIRERERFVLSSHARPDGDSIGAQLALAHALERLGKSAHVVNRDAPPASLESIPGAGSIEVASEVTGTYDAAIVLECSSLDRTEVTGLERHFLVNIDHHTGNRMYGALNWYDPSAAACAEMVHDLVVALGVPLTPPIAIPLYAGILTDTGSFRHANITRRTFDICSRVAASGVDVAAVAAGIYQSGTIGRLRLTAALVDAMRLAAGDRVALLRVDDALLRDTGCPPDDMDGLINLPLSARAVQAVVMIKALDGTTRVSLRSKGEIDVRKVAVSFGGGGHRNAAGFSVDGERTGVEARIVAAVAAAVEAASPGSPRASEPAAATDAPAG